MSRDNLAATFLSSAYAQDTPEVYVMLLILTYNGPSSPTRIAANNQDIVSEGNTYIGVPVQIVLPTTDGDRVSECDIVLSNIGQELIDEIRSLSDPITAEIRMITASDPNTVLVSYGDLTLRDIGYDALSITGRLTMEDFLGEPYPQGVMSAALFPGLF